MDAADRKANQVRDVLYAAGVRANDHVHLDAFPSADRETVLVSVHRHHYDCESCRSKSSRAGR